MRILLPITMHFINNFVVFLFLMSGVISEDEIMKVDQWVRFIIIGMVSISFCAF